MKTISPGKIVVLISSALLLCCLDGCAPVQKNGAVAAKDIMKEHRQDQNLLINENKVLRQQVNRLENITIQQQQKIFQFEERIKALVDKAAKKEKAITGVDAFVEKTKQPVEESKAPAVVKIPEPQQSESITKEPLRPAQIEQKDPPKKPLNTLFLMLGCGIGFIVAYNTYGKFLARKIFKLDPSALVPSKEFNDGVDYVPTRRGIIFGHHFTSIAGTGPIVGPAIGIIWGWVPALLWVFLGSIFLGAVHDFGTLIVSMRNEGKSISEIAAKYINPRVRFIFFVIVFLALLIVIAVFGMVIAIVFARFPSSIIPVWFQIPIAVGLGYFVYKRNGNIFVSTAVSVAGMYAFIALGAYLEKVHPGITTITGIGPIPATGVWTIILLIYAWVASTLPVTTLLQPRDYINAWQLFIMMALLVLGVAVSSLSGKLEMVAPAINTAGDIPSMWPLMFVTIACGAISGFHSLVASGTSTKQVSSERDSLFVGYGSMLLEGFLAVLIITCVGAGIGMAYKTASGEMLFGTPAWQEHYASFSGAAGMGAKLNAVVIGAANMMGSIGIPAAIGITLMGVFIASFAGTTLDTSVRIQRYVISELAADLRIPLLANKWAATTLAVVTAAALAFITGADGKGAMKLWPLFGAANQLLAALALLVVTMYLKRKGGLKFFLTAIPCLIMLTVTCWAMIENEKTFFQKKDWLLVIIGGGVFLLAAWMTMETLIVFFRPSKAVPAASPGALDETSPRE